MDEDKVISQGFSVFDVDGDGYISVADLRSMMVSLGEDVDDDQLNDIVKEIDQTGDKRISFEDFRELVGLKD